MLKLVTQVIPAVVLLFGLHGELDAQRANVASPYAVAIAQVLTRAGLETTAAQVQIPSGLAFASGSLEFQLASAEWFPGGHLRARLTCKPTGSCQPFFAEINPDPSRGASPLLGQLKNTQQLSPAASDQDGPRLLAGKHTILLLEDAHMRILLPVIAIDTGLPGATVRVSSLDRKQTFQAVVSSRELVRGALP